MLKLLIIEDNAEILKNLTNIIASNFSEIRLYSISFDGKSVLNLIENNIIDIIILDLKLTGISGVDIIKYIESHKLDKYKNSIIVFSGETQLLNKIIHSSYLYSYILKGNGFNTLLKDIKSLIQLKNLETLNIRIDTELKHLNYNFSYDGTKYLRETIIEIYKIKDHFDGNLNKNIYPIIARRYHKKTNTIYCDIKHATNLMTYDCNEQTLNSYLKKTYYSKPKINDIIYTILNKL